MALRLIARTLTAQTSLSASSLRNFRCGPNGAAAAVNRIIKKISNRRFLSSGKSPSEEIISDKDNFNLRFNVENFSPEDLQIKVIGNILVIEGMHGEKEDEGGVIRRYFVRKYTIPECFDSEKVLSSLSTKGILEIQAPMRKCIDEPVVERTIPIQKSP